MASNNDPLGQLVGNLFKNSGKSIEKAALYVTGILTATGVLHLPSNYKDWLTAAVAAVLTGLHVSTPTPKSGPSQV